MTKNRFEIQDAQYDFPYHYIPYLDRERGPQVYSYLDWGLQYLTYMTYVRYLILSFEPNSVLDVGCGEGRLLSMLGNRVPKRVGVDLSQRAIAFARAFVPDAEFVVGTAEDISAPFDVVACIETLEHIADEDMTAFVKALRSKMNQCGKLVVSVPSSVLPLNVKHYRHYTIDLLREQLSLGFRLVQEQHLVQHNRLCYLLSRLLTNRWFIVTWPTWRRWIWHVFKRKCYFARPGEGEHIVAVFEVASRGC